MVKRQDFQRIDALRRTFPKEWLLVEVGRFDPTTTRPLTGRLLAHSPRRHPLERRAARGKGLLYLVYGTDTLPQGYAAAF